MSLQKDQVHGGVCSARACHALLLIDMPQNGAALWFWDPSWPERFKGDMGQRRRPTWRRTFCALAKNIAQKVADIKGLKSAVSEANIKRGKKQKPSIA